VADDKLLLTGMALATRLTLWGVADAIVQMDSVKIFHFRTKTRHFVFC